LTDRTDGLNWDERHRHSPAPRKVLS
jgi:hypothetical protein